MIRYSLTCENDHRFDSWFQSSAAYETLRDGGHLSCTTCGSASVRRALMAPRLSQGGTSDAPPAVTAPPNPMEQALAALRKQIEDNSDYVGLSFAKQARDMHEGLAPHRPIYGEAKPEEAKSLIEDGVPVAPLPFVPKRRTN